MKELEQILQLWNTTKAAGESAILATVVKTQGSSYRTPGAHLLLTSTGAKAGSVSGGCLEDDLVKKAWWLTENGPVVRRYDTTPDGEIAPAFGLGCNGIIHVLLERLTPSHSPLLDLLEQVANGRRPAVVAHVISPPAASNQKLFLGCDRTITDNFADPALAALIESEAASALAENASRSVLAGDVEVFIETVAPPVRLLVFGAGDDAVPLTEMAHFLGWQVFVFDGRAHYARRDRFKHADEVIVRDRDGGDGELCPHPEKPAFSPIIDPWTVAVLMSHSYSQDLSNLRHLSSEPLRYLGILGPRKRTLQLLADASLPPNTLSQSLHGPMGLDIGADGPEQVALSVLAEIQATLNGREGGLLAKRGGSIHSRNLDSEIKDDESSSASIKFQVRSIVCA